MKTARFNALVEKGGRPSVHLTWAPPDKDRMLQKALAEDRVVTIHQRTRGSKKDFAVLGLEVATDSQYLIFPKALSAFKDHKIVGIQYDLLADRLSVGPTLTGRKIRNSTTASTQNAKIIRFPEKPNEPKEITPGPGKVKIHPERYPKLKTRHLPRPVEKIIRQALADLAEGFPSKAERGLQSLLPT